MSDTPQRVFLHVGVPKSGTTFLQATLARNRAELAEHGILYPSGKHDLMFRSALDVRGNHKAWGRKRADVSGAWDEVCRQARAHPGTTVVSHELLAAATPRRIATAMTMLTGLEVHLVVTARDPVRQATAEWQEGIKHGSTLTFRDFQEAVFDGDGTHERARRFAAAQDLPEVLARWGAGLPPTRVHIVCCPRRGAAPAALWRRFGEAVGLEPGRYVIADDRAANSSLGVVEIDLLRRVNLALDSRLVQPEYGRVVKHYFAKQLLAAHHSIKPEVPAALFEELARVGERWTKEVERSGYSVHGPLEDLVPTLWQDTPCHPDDVDQHALVGTAASAIAELLLEVSTSHARVAELTSQKKALKKKRKALKRRLAEVLGV